MRYFLIFTFFISIASSCKHVNVYEKQVDLPQHEWKRNQNAVIRFEITDSSSHQLYLVVRHTQKFPFNKLLVRLLIQDTAKRTVGSMHINAPLTHSNGSWNGIPMDDIYYSRIKVNPPVFLRPGSYRFVLQQAMKEQTIPYILNVGIALNQ
ncbi:gliding motility lipoprotein GldH [Niabella hibiscisoli]|uniref:gliding motility lipoprotein GldH n=1 Tax=Niabella hibiscisoli TaxID=1825928 RepID=UPI001F11622D|nr:gliding motility lipoprotein GldH [Niabella hibiscisoli]MCH5715910.1 gliding motility lipoprotein GldH [Niabella hibiscisoli]